MTTEFEPEEYYFWIVNMKDIIRNGPDYRRDWSRSDKLAYKAKLYDFRLTICSLTIGIAFGLWIGFQVLARMQK